MRGCEDGSAPRCWGSFHCWLFSGLIDWNVKSVDKNNNEAETCDIMFSCAVHHTLSLYALTLVSTGSDSLFLSLYVLLEMKTSWNDLISSGGRVRTRHPVHVTWGGGGLLIFTHGWHSRGSSRPISSLQVSPPGKYCSVFICQTLAGSR